MASTIEHGSAREVWFATLAAPSTKYSFLIRDDAYSKTGTTLGRTVRLGDPIDLGPNSAWSQTSWEGGQDQDVWSDRLMFKEGSGDGATTPGKAKLWPGWKWPNLAYSAFLNTVNFTTLVFANGPTGWGLDVPLYFGTVDRTGRGGRGELYKYDAASDGTTLLHTFAGSKIAALSALNDQGTPGQWLAIGTSTEFIVYHIATDAPTVEVTGIDPIPWRGICPYGDATYYLSGKKLRKRTWASPGPAVHSDIKEMTSYESCGGLVVWNNRLWFGATRSDGRSDIFITDGTTVTQAIEMPGEFHIQSMAVHYGSLYISGFRGRSTAAGGITSEIYKYTGSSLTKLFTVGGGANGENNYIWDMVSFGKYLVWNRNGFTSTGRRPGLMYYDAEQDALLDGPTWPQDPTSNEVHCTSLHVWNNTLVSSFWDATNYVSAPAQDNPVGMAYVKVDGGVRESKWGSNGTFGLAYDPATKEQFITSSLYDGDLPGEKKVWLTGRIHGSFPAGTEVELKLLPDDGAEQSVKVITGSGAAAFQTIVFPLKVSGAYLKSTTLRYKVYLRNTDGTNFPSNNPTIDSLTIQWMPAPSKRRTWRVRAMCSDAQARLDGSANSLTTAQALADKLEELWASEIPVYFWEARTSGTPADTSDAKEVMLSDYLEQSFRLVSDETVVARDVSLTLTEIVQS